MNTQSNITGIKMPRKTMRPRGSVKAMAFKPGPDYRRNVHLDWWDDLTPNIMAEGFKEAADLVVAASREDASHPDRYFYPVATLYRHYLELQLKNLIDVGHRYLGNTYDTKPLQQHGLVSLWNLAKTILVSHWQNREREELEAIEDIVTEFQRWDPTSQEFRYYTDKAGNVHMKEKPKIVDLDNLAAVVGKVFEFLSGCEWGLRSELEIMDEQCMQHD